MGEVIVSSSFIDMLRVLPRSKDKTCKDNELLLLLQCVPQSTSATWRRSRRAHVSEPHCIIHLMEGAICPGSDIIPEAQPTLRKALMLALPTEYIYCDMDSNI